MARSGSVACLPPVVVFFSKTFKRSNLFLKVLAVKSPRWKFGLLNGAGGRMARRGSVACLPPALVFRRKTVKRLNLFQSIFLSSRGILWLRTKFCQRRKVRGTQGPPHGSKGAAQTPTKSSGRTRAIRKGANGARATTRGKTRTTIGERTTTTRTIGTTRTSGARRNGRSTD